MSTAKNSDYCQPGCMLMEAHEDCVTEDMALCVCSHSFAQHTKGPVQGSALYCRHCPCPEWEPK